MGTNVWIFKLFGKDILFWKNPLRFRVPYIDIKHKYVYFNWLGVSVLIK